MNKVKEKLKKYFSENDIDKLLEKLESKQRSFLINNNYFVKIGKNSNKFFFDNLIKEIDIYKNNRGNQNLPNLIDYYIDDNICLIILEKISSATTGTAANPQNRARAKEFSTPASAPTAARQGSSEAPPRPSSRSRSSRARPPLPQGHSSRTRSRRTPL